MTFKTQTKTLTPALLEEQLEAKTERWLYLEELAEQIAAQK